MNGFWAALWAEGLKARRSKISLLTGAAFSLLPVIDGVFMFILKDPERARSMGLISVKAQITAAVADWPTFFYMLLLGTAMAGAILFGFITAWVFGREFSEHTAKELLALPTPREAIVSAKFVLAGFWTIGLTLIIFGMGLGIASIVAIPGWSAGLVWASFRSMMLIALLTFLLTPYVALFASAGRGYLPPLGWAFLTMALGQIAIVLGWGDWFPWSVPGLLGSLRGPESQPIELHSYLVVLLTSVVGLVATFIWWRSADQTR